MFLRIITLLLPLILLAACLPDEGDVSARYNAINQRAHQESIAENLAASAENLVGYQTAAKMKQRSPLSDNGEILSNHQTVQRNPYPVAPPGITVSLCDDFGAIAYFNAPPQGTPALVQVGNSMAATLVLKFGHDHVGMKAGNHIQLPKIAQTLGCTVGNDIQDWSPIFATGYLAPDGMNGLPDPNKTTEPIFKRDVTIPCPNGMDGVIKREQTCQLMFPDNPASYESGEIIIQSTPNKMQRLDRTWNCTPDLSTTMPPPTPNEVLSFCRDPIHNIVKQEDNVIEMSVESMRQILNEAGPGFYTFYCRKNKDGSNTCDAKSFTQPPQTIMRCDKTTPTVRFVLNPESPLKLDAAGNLIGDPNATEDCGRGWRGKMTARYSARRCDLVSFDMYSLNETVLSSAQTIYRIGYAAAQCERDIYTTTACPAIAGSNPSKRIPVARRAIMHMPVAMEWSDERPSVNTWDTARVATNDSRAEIHQTAAEMGYIVPDIDERMLDGSDSDRIWSERLVDAMRKRNPASVSDAIIPGTCNNENNPCGSNQSTIVIAYDDTDTKPLDTLAQRGISFNELQCVGTGTCHILMGQDQQTCAGQCFENGNVITVLPDKPGGNPGEHSFAALMDRYKQLVLDPHLPPGYRIELRPISGGTNSFNMPSNSCQDSPDKRITIGSFSENGSPEIFPYYTCRITSKAYSSMPLMLSDVVQELRSRGRDIEVYVKNRYLFDDPPGTHPFSIADLEPNGSIPDKLSEWLHQPLAPIQNPCEVVR